MRKPKINKVDLLDMALNIAAMQALKSEVYDTEMHNSVIGKDCPCQSNEQWIRERKEDWMEEALAFLHNTALKA